MSALPAVPRPRNRRAKAVKIPKPLAAAEHGLFFALLKREGLPLPVTEFRFHPDRKWAMDFAWQAERLFLEVDGGIWIRGGGRHNRGKGWLADSEKLNAAAAMGWRHLRCTPQQLHDLALIATIRAALTLEPR